MSEQVTSVTFDDVVSVMGEFGVTLTLADDEPIGSANLNGYNVTFALVNNTAVIVRADKTTEEKVADGNPTFFLACNHFNAYVHSTKAAAVNRTEMVIIRTECEFIVAAGLTHEQLKSSVDNVLAAQENVAQLSASLQGNGNTESEAKDTDN